MGKDLLDELVDKPQRETAGADVGLRFDYQKNWAFCEMLRRHMENAEYLVAFEFHDDVLFISADGDPKQAEFFQVKTAKSAKPRTLADLIRVPAAKPNSSTKHNSIIGKMFLNFDGICSDHSVKVILVSNVAFEFADANLSATDLDPKYREKIVAKLKAELPNFTEAQVDGLHFVISGVSIEAMQSFLHGEAMELFRTRFGENHGFNVLSWIRLIQGEIARRNNYPSATIKNVADLIGKKCVSRQDVDESLKVVAAQRKAGPDMSLVSADLQAAGWLSIDIMKLQKSLPTATYDYNDTTNSEALDIVRSLEARYDAFDIAQLTLAAFLNDCEVSMRPHVPPPYNTRHYFAALALVVFHEKL